VGSRCLFVYFCRGQTALLHTVPRILFGINANCDVQYSDLHLSDPLVLLLKSCLEKDPNKRVRVGECLHLFIRNARERRIRQLGPEFAISKSNVLHTGKQKSRLASRTVPSVPVQVLRSIGKKTQKGLAHTQDNLSAQSLVAATGNIRICQKSLRQTRSATKGRYVRYDSVRDTDITTSKNWKIVRYFHLKNRATPVNWSRKSPLALCMAKEWRWVRIWYADNLSPGTSSEVWLRMARIGKNIASGCHSKATKQMTCVDNICSRWQWTVCEQLFQLCQ